MKFCTFWRLKFTKLTKFRTPKIAKTAIFALLESPKVISRKIWMTEESWNFHTVLLSRNHNLCGRHKIRNLNENALISKTFYLVIKFFSWRFHNMREKEKPETFSFYVETSNNLSLSGHTFMVQKWMLETFNSTCTKNVDTFPPT